MALILGKEGPERFDYRRFVRDIRRVFLDEAEKNEQPNAQELIWRISPPGDFEFLDRINELMEAKIEVFVPQQSNQYYGGTMIIWNATSREAPTALLTSRKIDLDTETSWGPLTAWALQSAPFENDCELTLNDHLPMEIYHAEHGHYCGFDYFYSSETGAPPTPEKWQKEHLLKW